MMEREETASSFGVARVGTSWDDALGGQEGVPPNIIRFGISRFSLLLCTM